VGEVPPPFVDCHSHVCPSGDDGASTVAEGALLCREAAMRGTAILFATPHVWPSLTLTAARERLVQARFAELQPRAGLELRLGYELTPSRELLRERLDRYVLEDTGRVLMEVPFSGGGELLQALARRAEAAGLVPVIAHPERSEAAAADPGFASRLAHQGWPLQVNATSVLGRHGRQVEQLAWRLLERGEASLVASDGHRQTRPPQLDEAWAAVSARLGEERAGRLFDGSALGLGGADAATTTRRRTPSRVGTRDA
jgi:protein-tyrosine phosphatase